MDLQEIIKILMRRKGGAPMPTAEKSAVGQKNAKEYIAKNPMAISPEWMEEYARQNSMSVQPPMPSSGSTGDPLLDFELARLKSPWI